MLMVQIDRNVVSALTDARAAATAVEAARLADPRNSLEKAQAFRTTQVCTVYQWSTGQRPYPQFWFPFDPREIPDSPSTPRVKATLPVGTTIVIGARRDPHVPDSELVTQWFIGETNQGARNEPPASWRLQVVG
jgi:hypothetical protein